MPAGPSGRPRPVGFHDDAPRPGRHDFFDAVSYTHLTLPTILLV